MKRFDDTRSNFAPYGFTCEQWEPSVMKRPDRHNEIEVNLISQGTITYLLGGSKIMIPSYRLVMFWAAIPHHNIGLSSSQPYYVMTIPLVWFLQWHLSEAIREPILHGKVIQIDISKSWTTDSIAAEEWCSDLETRSQERHEIALLEIEARIRRIAIAVRSQASSKRKTQRKDNYTVFGSGDISKAEAIACFIAQNYQQKLTAQEIGSNVGLHPNYAMILFKKTFDTTINEYITQHRLYHAQRLLATTDEKILSVALDSGFGTLSRFNEAFKSAFSCTPRQYRMTHR